MSSCYGNGGVPDFCQDKIIEDFEAIWARNTIQVALIRNDPEPFVEHNADFFGTTQPRRKKIRLVELNIQSRPRNISRTNQSISDDGAILNALAKHDEDN